MQPGDTPPLLITRLLADLVNERLSSGGIIDAVCTKTYRLMDELDKLAPEKALNLQCALFDLLMFSPADVEALMGKGKPKHDEPFQLWLHTRG
jgi:hypothetical protein